MQNIFKKISISIVILTILVGPMTTLAADMILYGINGSGTWEQTKNGNTFEGNTTDPDNKSATGTWSFDGFDGNWTSEIKSGKIINGTLKSNLFAPKIPSGNWVGGGSKKNESIVTSVVVPGDTYANLSGKYLEGYFTKVYFKYGEDNTSSIKTLGKVLPSSAQKTTYITYNEDITGLKPDGVGYYYIFCGEKNGQETCGESLNFKTQKKDWNNIDNTTKVDTKTEYTYLAPLGEDKSFDARIECAFADYANKFIKIFIGICALLAMVMIISGGIQYMTSELVSSEVQGKTIIMQAVFGLILAVSGYAILNTINPKLLDLCIDQNLPQANVVVLPDAGDDTVDPDFASGVKKYSTDASVSPELAPAIAKLKDGWKISKINVYSSSNKMQIDLQNGTEFDNTTYINMAPGVRGYAQIGSATQGDKKTPLGNWKILNIEYTPGVAQFNGKGSNMGAAFWLLSPMTSGERGIGIHGNKNGTLSATNGCVRLKNSDILELQPFIKTGIQVVIQ